MNDFPATVFLHTVQGPVPCCERHANGLSRLMAMLGAHTNATPAPEGTECSNCRNEAKAKGTPA